MNKVRFRKGWTSGASIPGSIEKGKVKFQIWSRRALPKITALVKWGKYNKLVVYVIEEVDLHIRKLFCDQNSIF